MSLRVMSLVWENFKRGGSEKLALLAMADWCNDQGGSLRPSMRAIAAKIGVSEKQARVVIHRLIDGGYLTVIGNAHGGKPGQSRHYRLNVEQLLTPPLEGTTPPQVRNPSCKPVFTPPPERSQTTSEPSGTVRERKSAPPSVTATSTFDHPKTHQGTRLQPDWIPDEASIADAFRIQPGWSREKVLDVAESFRDYWVSLSGSRGIKADWHATWRNWVRRERSSASGGHHPSAAERREAERRDALAILTGRRPSKPDIKPDITPEIKGYEIQGEASRVA